MKIVFLDVDGVLNSAQYLRENPGAFDGRHLWQMLDPKACARLHQFGQRSGAFFVLSSSWRIPFRLPDVRAALSERGFGCPLIDRTPVLGKPRGLEIQRWLDGDAIARWNVTSLVILDDSSDMEHLSHRLVRTTYEYGLQDEHVQRALELLELR